VLRQNHALIYYMLSEEIVVCLRATHVSQRFYVCIAYQASHIVTPPLPVHMIADFSFCKICYWF